MKRHIRKFGLPVFTVTTFLGAIVLAVLTFHSPVVPAARAAPIVKAADFLPQHPAAAQLTARSLHPLMAPHPMVPPAPTTYTVRPGDTLSGITHKLWGHASEWPRLWYANRHKIPNPLSILRGQKLILPSNHNVTPRMRRAALAAIPKPSPSPAPAVGSGDSAVGTSNNAPAPSAPVGGTVLSAAQIGALWLQEGGSPGAESTAICIAEHESGGNTQAISPTNDWGLFQINGGGPAMLNPVANTLRAIAMSGNGTNWSPWTTAGSCGV